MTERSDQTTDLPGLAGKKSIREDLIDHLKRQVCVITFKKVDGTMRTINGTLMEEFLAEEVKPYDTNHKTSESVLPFYDVDGEHWKSARLDSLVYFTTWTTAYAFVSVDNDPFGPQEALENLQATFGNDKDLVVIYK